MYISRLKYPPDPSENNPVYPQKIKKLPPEAPVLSPRNIHSPGERKETQSLRPAPGNTPVPPGSLRSCCPAKAPF